MCVHPRPAPVLREAVHRVVVLGSLGHWTHAPVRFGEGVVGPRRTHLKSHVTDTGGVATNTMYRLRFCYCTLAQR